MTNFDPFSRGSEQFPFSRNIYETLIQFDEEMKPSPVLASKWTIAPDKQSVTLELKKGVKFHDGKPFDAKAVVANIARAQNPETGQHTTFFASPIRKATARGDSVVELALKQPTPDQAILDMLQALPMVSPASFDKLGRSAAGTGPYKLVKWTPGTSVELAPAKPNDGDGPFLDRLVFQIFSDANAAVAALRSGSVDALENVPPDQVRRLRADGFKIVKGATSSTVLEVRMNPSRRPFTSKAFRRAVSQVIDRDLIVENVLAGYGEPALTPLFVHHSDAKRAELAKTAGYSPDQARRVLKQADDPSFTIILWNGIPAAIPTAQILQGELAKLGVRVKLERLDLSTYGERLMSGDYDATIVLGPGGNHYPSQITYGSAWRPEENALWGNNVPKQYLDALEEMRSALTPEDQEAGLERLTNAIIDMGTVYTISDHPLLYAVNDKVAGFGRTVDSMPLYGGVSLEG